MNIGIVTTWFDRGAAYVSKAYMEALSPDHKVFIYARGGEKYARGDPNWDHEYVTWGKITKIKNDINLKDFYKWLSDNEIQLLIFNEQIWWNIVALLANSKILIGSYVDYYKKNTVKFFRLYDFLLCNTKRHYSVFKNHPNALYIPWGTNLELFFPRPKPFNKNLLIFYHSAGMGGVNLRKGTDILVKAFTNVVGDVRLIIHSQVGIDHYPVIKETILKDKRIIFLCSTCPPPGLFYWGDVYVYPSRLEGIGLTIAEALASGLPVITTNSAPMNEFIIDNYNGRLIPIETTSARKDKYYWPEVICSETELTKAMQFYIENPLILEYHKKQARLSAEKHHNWKKNSSKISSDITTFKKIKKDFLLIFFVLIWDYLKKIKYGITG